MTLARAALALVAVVLTIGGCARQHGDSNWAIDIAARQQEADRLLDTGDPAAARAALTAAIAAAQHAPADDERRLVLQDTYFRLARLALGQRDPAQALTLADAGLALGTAPHLFVANLLVVKGAAHEALNDPRAAAQDYHRALTMNETLLQQALPSP